MSDATMARADMAGEGAPIPAGDEVIVVRVAELRQFFYEIDPAPLPERDLEPMIEEFIVEWAREVPRHVPLALLVHVDRPGPGDAEAGLVAAAVARYFEERAESARRRLRRLLRTGRTSLLIGLAVLLVFTLLAQVVDAAAGDGGVVRVVREGLAIAGWVAMWRPLEIFLYDWWPIRSDAQLYDRLAVMPVRILHDPDGISSMPRRAERPVRRGRSA